MDESDTNSNELKFNPLRLDYLLSLYNMTKEDLVTKISGKRRKLQVSDLDNILEKGKIPLPILKKIDAIFKKGMNWYATDRKLPDLKSSSIFFRKDKFNTELNFESRKITNNFEERKFEIQNLCSAIGFKTERKIKLLTLNVKPKDAAKEMRTEFDSVEKELIQKKVIKKPRNDYDYLKNYITIIESYNVFVFEFLETWNKKEKTIFNGFFLKPNIIVIKGQKHRRREIFTLIHEFAHYLLDSEEIDNVNEGISIEHQSKIERWCNDFVYHFLIGNLESSMKNMGQTNKVNHYNEEKITEIYNKTALSRTALYTHLVINNYMSRSDYDTVISSIRKAMGREEDSKKMLLEQEKAILREHGKKIPPMIRKPIQSQLFKEIVKVNYFGGYLDEIQVCNYLRIKSDKIQAELY